MNTFVWTASLFWAFVYGIRSFRKSYFSQSLLPPSAFDPSASRANRSKCKALQISVRNFHLEVRTSLLNPCHDSWIEFFEDAAKRSWARKNVLRVFYDVGVVFGFLGFLLGICTVGYSTCKFFSAGFASQSETPRQLLGKRDAEFSGAIQDPKLAINALIPGVTVPWSHLPFILLALFVAQCFHEAGHAVAGAIEGLPLQAMGASLTFVLPSAFVAFSSSMDSLSSSARLRVISSGAWHNLVLWGLLYLVSFVNVSLVWNAFGWKDISDLGVVVLDVEENSPLIHHLPPGSLISTLDDISLSTTGTSADDIWSRYLLAPMKTVEQGWCVDVDAFFTQPTICCDLNTAKPPAHPPAAQLSCFVPMQDGDQGHCIDPVPLVVSSPSQRCYASSDCKSASMDEPERGSKECVRPNESAHLLRIGISPPVWGNPEDEHNERLEMRTVLWSGPKDEVWEQVKVGTLAPRYRFLPLWFPNAISTFFSYLSTLSLSLYIFNLFALPFLDGSHFLSAILECIGNSRNQASFEGQDIELGVGLGDSFPPRRTSTSTSFRYLHISVQRLGSWIWGWRRRIRRRKATIERAVRYVTIALMCTTVVGMAWSA